MKKISFVIFALFFFQVTSSSQSCLPCLPNGITFEIQDSIDNFQINHPGCTEIAGDVHIGGYLGFGGIPNYSSILNLNGLSVLTSIGGNLSIWLTDTLTSLAGLENLTSVGGDLLIGMEDGPQYSPNISLISISDLSNLTSIGGDLWIVCNYVLPGLNGLDSLSSIGGDLWILLNHALTSLNGLNSVDSIGGNLWIEDNDKLTSLTGIGNINAGSITDLNIRFNDTLSDCAVQSICNYLSSPNGITWIYYNALGCYSQAEVNSACNAGSNNELWQNNEIDIYPNPTSDMISIDFGKAIKEVAVTVKNIIGQTIFSKQYNTTNLINLEISDSPGIYFLEILTNENKSVLFKVIKE